MNLAVVSETVETQTPLYKGVWSIEVSTDVTHWRFTAVLVVNAEWDEVLHFAKRCPTWTRIMWMQPLMT
jgi:hypothetical protein